MNKTHVTRRAAVTLTHEEAANVAATLRAYASSQWQHARRTQNRTVQALAEQYGRAASDLEASIVARMFTPDETYPETPAQPETCPCGCGSLQHHQTEA